MGFAHGIPARAAALLAAALRTLAADVRVRVRGREANARSTVALMALGVQHGEEIELHATGPDAQNAISALAAVFTAHGEPAAASRPAVASPRKLQSTIDTAAAAAPGRLPGVVASPGLALGYALQLRRPEIRVAEAGGGVEIK